MAIHACRLDQALDYSCPFTTAQRPGKPSSSVRIPMALSGSQIVVDGRREVDFAQPASSPASRCLSIDEQHLNLGAKSLYGMIGQPSAARRR